MVTEIDPICALQAAMEGYEVVTLEDVRRDGRHLHHRDRQQGHHHRRPHGRDEAPGDRRQHRPLRQRDRHGRADARPTASSGSTSSRRSTSGSFADGHSIIVLSEGRLLNLGNATGHPSFVMSNSFTNQVIAQIELFTKNDEYEKQVYVLPKHLDEKVARLHLDALGVELTELTPDQAAYIGVPVEGPYKPRPLPATKAPPRRIADPAPRPERGGPGSTWAEGQMPVLRSIRERFATSGRWTACGWRPACTSPPRRPTWCGRWRPAGRRSALLRGQPALDPGRRRGGAGRGPASPSRPRAARTLDAYVAHVAALAELAAADHARRRRRPADAVMHARGEPTPRSAAPRRPPPACCACAGSRPRAGSRCPVLAVNEARTERTFNDRYGTGQSALDGILRATNLLLAGHTLVLLGYGFDRQGDRPARPRRRRGRDRLRGRPAARARGAHGRLRGDAGARGGRARRPVRHRHRLARRAARASTSSA